MQLSGAIQLKYIYLHSRQWRKYIRGTICPRFRIGAIQLKYILLALHSNYKSPSETVEKVFQVKPYSCFCFATVRIRAIN